MKYDFDSILARLRSGVQGTVSTLEGTFAGDLLQSVAAELARIWSQEVDTAAQRGFLATAEGQWLDAVCGDYGITRKSGESDEGLRARALEQVRSRGGGGTAALVGAAGVALGNMVGNLTTGKKKYAAVEADIQALNTKADALRKELEALVQADADAFAPLAAAYGLPKDTPEQAAHKAAVLEKALDAACAVPLEVMEKCAEGIALVEEYAAKGSVMAVSDAGCAAALCKAALQAASLNVFINTKLMADRERAAALDAKTDKLLDEFVSRADAVFASVTNKLRNK